MRSKAVHSIVKVTAGIDWISGTLSSDEVDYQTWVADCTYALKQEALGGYIIEMRRLQGYEGMGYESTFVGVNDDRAFAQFSGEKANRAYDYLDHPKVHISRLDLQITVQTDVMDYNQGKRCLVAARTYNKALPTHKQRKIDFWLGEGGSDTVYIGSKSSDIRLRIYNKETQSEELRYTRCWRYEAVLRNEVATSMYRKCILAGDQATDFILSTVLEYGRQRGIVLPGLEHIDPVPLDYPSKPPTDIERKLKWLEKQVKPTLEKLSAQGYGDQAAKALGLTLPDDQT
jgi:hypothetical protein